MQVSTGTHAADQLHQAQVHLAELERSEQQLREQLASSSSHAAICFSQVRGISTDTYLATQPVPDLLRAAVVLESGLQYVQRLEELQKAVTDMGQGLAQLQAALNATDWHAYLNAVLQGPVKTYQHVQASSDAFAEVPMTGLPDRLVRAGGQSLSKARQAQDELLRGLNLCLKALLKHCHWPPALASDAASQPNPHKRPWPGSAAQDEQSPEGHLQEPLEALQETEARSAGRGSWQGFEGAGPVVLQQLQDCVFALLACQQGILAAASFPLDMLPMLDVVQTITEPLLAKLRFHFASGRPTDRIDQPDWLFETAAEATKQHLETFKALQPAVQRHGLESVFYMPFEFARAMHAAVQTVLREHVLPRLAQQGTQDLWTFYADSVVAFEQKMSILQGIYIDDTQMDHDGPFAWGRGSCLELVFARDSWRDAWLQAEAADAQEQLQDILDRLGIWDASPSVNGAAAFGQLPLNGDSKGKGAWTEEFWPSTAAEYVLNLLWTLSKRGLWLSDPELRQAYVVAVPKGMLRAFRTRLGRLAKTAEDLHNLASPDWIPKLATYTNACHYLAYHLRQSHLAVLLLYDPSTPAPSPQTTRASTPAPPSSLPATPAVVSSTLRLPSPSSADFRSYASPADSTATAEAAKASTTGLLGAYESEAVALESFWEKWALKLAKAVAQQFDLDTRSYRYKSHLAEFANTSYSQQEGEETVAPQLQRALVSLDDTIGLLAANMDAVVFRKTWTAIAFAIHLRMFNGVVSDTRFSYQGGRQLACDTETLFSVFQPYTHKASAHFKELRDASVLLSLEPDALHQLRTALQDASPSDGKEKLKRIGVLKLTTDQAIGMLDQRL